MVQSQSDMRNDPQLEHRGFWQWREHPEVGQMPYDGLQFLLSKTPGGILRHQAMIGEHNEMILKEWVGLSDEEFLDLLLSDALETSLGGTCPVPEVGPNPVDSHQLAADHDSVVIDETGDAGNQVEVGVGGRKLGELRLLRPEPPVVQRHVVLVHHQSLG